MTNRVVIDTFSAKPSVMYCMVTPCECRIAIVIYAIWIPFVTAAVANPRLRLCIVALCHPNTGAKILSILAMKALVMGTTLHCFIRTNNGLITYNLSLRLKRRLTITFNHFTKDMCVLAGLANHLMRNPVALVLRVIETYLDILIIR